ncbi:MAG: DUF349 domain-containing protein [Tunicatimonas sp.]
MDTPATPYGFIRDDKIYRAPFLDHPEREIGEVRESEASTIQYFQNRFTMAENKVASLEQSVEESENKGSYLMKLVHLRDNLAKFDALGDYPALFVRLDAVEEMLRDIIAKNRIKNLEIKRALIEEAEVHEHSSDWKEGADSLQEIKEKWIKTGAVDEEYQVEVEDRFNQILDTFYQRRKDFFQSKKELTNVRIRRYKEINFEMHQLVRQDDKRAAQQRVKELQKDWREVGKIPVFKYKRLQSDFRSLANRIFGSPDQASSYRSPDGRGTRQFAPRQNSAPAREGWVNPNEAISTKKDLIQQAQQLAEDTEGDTIQEVRRLREAWKNSGRISREKSIELTTQFNTACDQASEQSFLNRAARAEDSEYDNIPRSEQVSLKIDLLEKSLERDERELANRRENVGNQANPLEARQAENRLRQQIRKVNTKRELIQSLKNELAEY